MSEPIGAWEVREEFAQRLGCGVATAVLLPLWFLLLVFVVPTNLALTVSVVLFVLTTALAAAALVRARRVPRQIRIEPGGALVTRSQRGERRYPLTDLERVELGSSLGVWPLQLHFAGGRRVRLPRDIDDLSGLLAALERSAPSVTVADRNPGPAER